MKKKNAFDDCQAVIFDMDGVIVDSEPIHGEAFKVFLDELNVTYSNIFVDNLVGHSVNHNIKTINETYLSTRPLDIDEGVRMRNAIYLDLITARKLNPMPGIEDLIKICKQRGVKLGLASSSVREQIDTTLDNLSQNSEQNIDFQTIFDITVSGDEVLNKKPAPDIYRKVISKIKIDPSVCIAIEDSGAGILSAKACDIFCIALRNQYLKEKNAQNADLIVNSIGEIVKLM